MLHSHLDVYLHGFLVEGNVNQLHPEVMCGFIKGCVDADGCDAARRGETQK